MGCFKGHSGIVRKKLELIYAAFGKFNTLFSPGLSALTQWVNLNVAFAVGAKPNSHVPNVVLVRLRQIQLPIFS
jgi:hypothetical protein